MNPIAREKYLDDRELAALLLAARSSAARNRVRDYTLLALLVNTGMRPGEALALKLRDLWLGGHEPRIRVHRLKKRREQGVIDDLPISRGLARAVARYLEAAELDQAATPEAPLFPMGVRNAEHIFKRHARAAGIRPEARLYSLRHTAGTRAYAASKDLRLVQEMLGHASPNTTAIYTHVDPEARRRTAERTGIL